MKITPKLSKPSKMAKVAKYLKTKVRDRFGFIFLHSIYTTRIISV